MGNLFFDEPGVKPSTTLRVGDWVRVTGATSDGEGDLYEGMVGRVSAVNTNPSLNIRYPVTVTFGDQVVANQRLLVQRSVAKNYTFRTTELQPTTEPQERTNEPAADANPQPDIPF